MKYTTILALFMINGVASAASPQTFIDLSCPEEWESSGVSIPVIATGISPWGESVEDKTKAKTHIASADVLDTIDTLPPANSDERVNDLLTIASECLVYKNLLVNGEHYYPPSGPIIRKKSNGWIPATF